MESLPRTEGVEYRAVSGFEGYAIGDDGSPWSCKRGEWKRMKADLVNGYPRVSLYRNGEVVRRFVHQLVLETFVGPCPDGMEACHDPDPSRGNCRLSNLRWDTRLANHDDQYKHGTRIHGEAHHRAKLTDTQVVEIRERFSAGETAPSIAVDYGISRDMVLRISNGRNWQHVGGPTVTPRTKLTIDQVRLLKQLSATESRPELSKRFGIAEGTVAAILTGKRWGSVTAWN